MAGPLLDALLHCPRDAASERAPTMRKRPFEGFEQGIGMRDIAIDQTEQTRAGRFTSEVVAFGVDGRRHQTPSCRPSAQAIRSARRKAIARSPSRIGRGKF